MSARSESRLLGSHDIKSKELTFCEHNFDNWTKSSTILVRQGQVPSRSPNLLSSQNFSRLPFLAGERGKCFRESNLTGFWKLFWNTRLRFENSGKIHGMGLDLSVRGSTVPAAFNRGNRTKDQNVLDLVKSSKLCSILNAQRIQACAMRFCKM